MYKCRIALSVLGALVLAGSAIAEAPERAVPDRSSAGYPTSNARGLRPEARPIVLSTSRSVWSGEPARPRSKTRPANLELAEVRPVAAHYEGDERLVRMLIDNKVVPAALASGDFDRDGMPDLICGYTGPGGNLVTMHLGNVDAVYPDSPDARARRLQGTSTDEPFLGPARVFGLPVTPDFLAAGDFDNDGRPDIVAAHRGGEALYLLAGDGGGRLGRPRRLALSGTVTTLTSGEINRADGVTDLIVGVKQPNGSAVLVFEGPRALLEQDPERISLPSVPTALALGRLTGGTFLDLAVTAGNDLLIVQGRDRRMYLHPNRRNVNPPVVVEAVTFDSPIRTISVGDYAWTGNPGLEIAVLDAQGTLRLVGSTDESGVKAWRQIGERRDAFATDSDVLLQTARVSGLPLEELVALDRTDRRLQIMLGEVRGTDAPAAIDFSRPLSKELDGQPIAGLTMRLDRDALGDLVLLQSGSIEPLIVSSAPAAVITVNSMAGTPSPNGYCELAEAIDNANANLAVHADCAAGAGADLIAFAIDGGGMPKTIWVFGTLPALTDPGDTIDATTQGCIWPLCVSLDGGLAAPGTPGLTITASVTVRGVAIVDFDASGILLDGSFGGAIIEGNHIGIELTGPSAPNNGDGVEVRDSSDNLIGGTVPAARNVISSNVAAGVSITATAAGLGADNIVEGNFIGAGYTGSFPQGNAEGVSVIRGTGNVIGGTSAGAGNLVSGNVSHGIVTRDGASGNLVQQNLVGTDATGLLALGNGSHGVFLVDSPSNTVGGATPGAGNVVSANSGAGIGAIASVAAGSADFTVVQGNIVGLDATGTAALGPGGLWGIILQDVSFSTVGGSTPEARNVSSYNGAWDIVLQGWNFAHPFTTQNVVQGNYVGTDVTGTITFGGASIGVSVYTALENLVGGPAPGERNLISGHGTSGVQLSGTSTGNRVEGNYIGTDVTGTVALGNGSGVDIYTGNGNTIGGIADGTGNLISGSISSGIYIRDSASGNEVQGNLIGTDADGNPDLTLGNLIGVQITQSATGNVIGGAGSGAGNFIAANGDGVVIDAPGNEVLGNTIGVDPDRPGPGNQLDGVRIENTTDNLIGGTDPGAGNLISGNGRDGIRVTALIGGGRNRVLGNGILGNAQLGIDLRGDGVTLNDAGDPDTGPNMLQNFPVMTSAAIDPTTTSVECTLDSLPSRSYRIEFFAGDSCDPSGHGEGARFLGAGYASTDVSGNATYPAAYPNANPPGVFVTATATDDTGNTSEFSACYALPDGDGDLFPDGPDCAPQDDQLWQVPGEVRGLLLTHTGGLSGTTTLAWNVPDPFGGTPGSIRYDTVASATPHDFSTSPTCVESNDGADTTSVDTFTPASGAVRYYLMRAENDCGDGSVGAGTTQVRSVGSCP